MSAGSSFLPWQRPCAQTLVDRGLYLITINGQIVPGVFVFHAKPGKFFWDGMGVALAEVDVCLFKPHLDQTLPNLSPSTWPRPTQGGAAALPANQATINKRVVSESGAHEGQSSQAANLYSDDFRNGVAA